MRTIAAIGAALFLAGATASAGVSTAPQLKLLSRTPVAVQGLHFKARELVALTAATAGRTQKRLTTATTLGAFRVTFAATPLGRC